MHDPIRQRTGLVDDIDAAVQLPALPQTVEQFSLWRAPEGRSRLSGDTPATAARRLSAFCKWITSARPGTRHLTLVRSASKAIELRDALSIEDIQAELLAAGVRAGLGDSERELLRQVHNGFDIGAGGTWA